jgi:chromosomal replication initiation ATPase DnaA
MTHSEYRKVEPFVYDDVKSIIKEEFAYIYNGERTSDKCIDILNDRVEKYLAENE